MKSITRRDFLKYSVGAVAGGMAVLVVSKNLPWLAKDMALAATQNITMHMTDAMKDMAVHNSLNTAQCYYWVYQCTSPSYPAESPAPVIMVSRGDTINITCFNDLDEPHTLSCPSLGVTSAPIPPGQSATITIPASICGAHLYYDHLNAPVNRVMGLHGTILVLPTEADRTAGHNLTPYGGLAASHGVQRLYDDFGRNTQTGVRSAHFPGLAWEEGDSRTWALYDPAIDGPTPVVNCPPMRSYIWLLSQASPKLFAEVGNAAPGTGARIPANFMEAFLRDPFQPHAYHTDNPGGNRIPSYFLINGQSGWYSHFSPYVTPMGRVGEPVVVHIINAGLWAHSMHLHANHMWITSKNGAVNPNPIWVDVFRVDPMDRVDYTIPFMRPPDVGHPRGIGLPETPLMTVANPDIPGSKPHPVWPPVEEFNIYMPALGTKAKNAAGQDVELGQRMSPLCYPMHDHSEPSQTSQGGNYNTGLISGIYFTGDRNGMMDFPMDEDFHMAYKNARGCEYPIERAAPPIGEIGHP
ncbi:MAG: multicopper oxidase domain-containing protein [Chloroflexi bacterium]|nr:multicopper oxidase domain-containing protein [Chloroflexota bacterium]